MSYTILVDQVERHRTNPDADMARKGTIDNILYNTRDDTPGQAAGQLRSVAEDGKFQNPYSGLTTIKSDGKRKLRQMANHLEGNKFVRPKRTANKFNKKIKSAPVKTGKKR